jgi:hypothetical protein
MDTTYRNPKLWDRKMWDSNNRHGNSYRRKRDLRWINIYFCYNLL